MNKVEKEYDVGVIIGRFQTPELHSAHRDLLDSVMIKHSSVVVFLGVSPTKSTVEDPLDYTTRKCMVQAAYHDAIILPLNDMREDAEWSKSIDAALDMVLRPASAVVLYGGRDSCLASYSGRYDTCELKQTVYISSTELRKKASNAMSEDKMFRIGMIKGSANQYPRVNPTVDVAIWNEEETELLMARKPNESGYRFIGGFADGGGSFEADVRREVAEEAHIEITDPKYIGSMVVDDWRYRGKRDSIKTLFFEAKYLYGSPQPDDDICELRWMIPAEIQHNIVDTHKPLFDMLMETIA